MDATKTTRLIELAREQAFIKHAHYVLMPNTQGHVQGMGDTEWGFSACPHPDCVLLRAAALDAAPSPDTLNARAVANVIAEMEAVVTDPRAWVTVAPNRSDVVVWIERLEAAALARSAPAARGGTP